MRRLIEECVAALPIEAAARRALEETLLDWRDEAAASPGAVVRLWRTFQALVALARAIAIITLDECREWRIAAPFIARVIAWIALFVAFSTAMEWRMFASWHRASTGALIGGRALLGLATAVSFVPAALFIAARRGARPFLALCVTSAVCTLLLAGWLTPHTNQMFRVMQFRSSAPPEVRLIGGAPPLGARELTLSELIGGIRAPGLYARPAVEIATRLAIVLACPAMLLLSVAVDRLQSRRRRWTVAIPIVYVLLTAYSGGNYMRVWLIPFMAVALAAYWMRRPRAIAPTR